MSEIKKQQRRGKFKRRNKNSKEKEEKERQQQRMKKGTFNEGNKKGNTNKQKTEDGEKTKD